MSIVKLDDLHAGMTLASDLVANGRMLLPAKMILEETHLKTLKAWGVSEVDIEDSAQAECGSGNEVVFSNEVSEDDLVQSQDWLLPFFFKPDRDHLLTSGLFKLATERVARQIAAGREFPPSPWTESATAEFRPPPPDSFWRKVPKNPETLFRGKVELFSLPTVYTHIVEVLNSPRSSAAHLAQMVEKDTSLASRLLKLVNSVFYGFPSRIDSISRAITLIGTNELTNMALGISVVRAFKDVPPGYISMEGFWRHSIACGIFARLLAEQKVGTSGELLFVGGLLHDIGRMILLKQIPEAYAEIIFQARQQRQPLYMMEKRLLSFDHTDVGRLLCKEWNFSKSLEEMICYHHHPGQGRYALGCSTVHAANLLAKLFYVGKGEYGCVMITSMQEKVWESLGLSIDALPRIFQRAEQQINEIIRLFLGEED